MFRRLMVISLRLFKSGMVRLVYITKLLQQNKKLSDICAEFFPCSIVPFKLVAVTHECFMGNGFKH